MSANEGGNSPVNFGNFPSNQNILLGYASESNQSTRENCLRWRINSNDIKYNIKSTKMQD